MRVSKNTLLGIAGVVWCIAGVNIVNIGLGAYGSLDKAAPGLVLALAAASVAVCALFWGKVFSKMLGKHVVRIQAMGDEAQPVWRFFDAKSYLIMAVMMGGGHLAARVQPGVHMVHRGVLHGARRGARSRRRRLHRRLRALRRACGRALVRRRTWAGLPRPWFPCVHDSPAYGFHTIWIKLLATVSARASSP